MRTVVDFSSCIEKYKMNFTCREWVFKEIDKWLDSKEPRVFLIIGGPGSGKTASASKIVQIFERQIAGDKQYYSNLTYNNLAFYHLCQAFNDVVLDPLRLWNLSPKSWRCLLLTLCRTKDKVT